MKHILVIGAGSIGERHLRCFIATGRTQVSFCEPIESVRSTIASRYAADSYADLTTALSSRPFDAAVICTPAHTHIDIANQLLDQGIPILIEKPLSTCKKGIDAFVERINEERHIAHVAYVHRSYPLLQCLFQLVTEQPYGPPKHLIVSAGQHFPTFRPVYRDIYYARHATGGGAIQDALTHIIHSVEWMFGPFNQLYCQAKHQVLEGVHVEDTVNLLGSADNDLLVNISLNQFQAPNEMVWSIHCPEGSLRAELHNQRIGTMELGAKQWDWTCIHFKDRDDAFINQANSFLDSIEGQPCNLATVADAAQTLHTQLAALESAQSGQSISISTYPSTP